MILKISYTHISKLITNSYLLLPNELLPPPKELRPLPNELLLEPNPLLLLEPLPDPKDEPLELLFPNPPERTGVELSLAEKERCECVGLLKLLREGALGRTEGLLLPPTFLVVV